MASAEEWRGLLEHCSDDEDEAQEWEAPSLPPPQPREQCMDKSFILLGCFAFAVSDINYHMLPPFLLRYLLKRGVSEAGVGIVMATPAPSSTAPVPKSQLSEWPPITTISSARSVPGISAITLPLSTTPV